MNFAVDCLIMGVLLGLVLGWSTGLLGRVRGAALYRVKAQDMIAAAREAKERRT